MAQALGWDRVAPFYIDLEAPVPLSGVPKPGPLQVLFPDDHIRYAVTWVSLAGLLLIALAVWLRCRVPTHFLFVPMALRDILHTLRMTTVSNHDMLLDHPGPSATR